MHAGQRDRQYFKTGLHTDTGYPVQTPNLHLIVQIFYKKVIVIFFLYSIIKYYLRVGTGNPVLLSRLSRILFYTLH